MTKNLLKRLLVPALASRPVSTIATRFFGLGIPIFMLHRIVPDASPGGGHTPSYLRQCLKYLRDNGYSFVSVEDILTHFHEGVPLPKKPVAFTVDDGFYDQASLAAPVFIEFDCPATIFLISGFLDGDLWPWFSKVEFLIENSKANAIEFDAPHGKKIYSISDKINKLYACYSIQETMKKIPGDRIPATLEHLAHITQLSIPTDPPDKFRPMTWSIARELEQAGIRFGPHTVSHPILSMINDGESETEITGSWQRLKDELSYPAPVFCYPNGKSVDFGNREITTIKNNGFIGAISTITTQVDLNPPDNNYLFRLPRFSLPETSHDFMMYCSWIECAKSKILHR
jgi:peptidoglycan/xylan/chitin deacetylase (PgdA/CDA1 family)